MEKEIIKLKGQVEILQNKATSYSVSTNRTTINEGSSSERLSVEALRRLEEQVVKLINPLREDVKKISDLKWAQ